MIGGLRFTLARARATLPQLATLAVVAAIAGALVTGVAGAVRVAEAREVRAAEVAAPGDLARTVVAVRDGGSADAVAAAVAALLADRALAGAVAATVDGGDVVIAPDPARISADELPALADLLAGLSGAVADADASGASVQVSGALDVTIDALSAVLDARRVPTAVALGILALLTAVVVGAVATEPVRTRTEENRLLRTRGAAAWCGAPRSRPSPSRSSPPRRVRSSPRSRWRSAGDSAPASSPPVAPRSWSHSLPPAPPPRPRRAASIACRRVRAPWWASGWRSWRRSSRGSPRGGSPGAARRSSRAATGWSVSIRSSRSPPRSCSRSPHSWRSSSRRPSHAGSRHPSPACGASRPSRRCAWPRAAPRGMRSRSSWSPSPSGRSRSLARTRAASRRSATPPSSCGWAPTSAWGRSPTTSTSTSPRSRRCSPRRPRCRRVRSRPAAPTRAFPCSPCRPRSWAPSCRMPTAPSIRRRCRRGSPLVRSACPSPGPRCRSRSAPRPPPPAVVDGVEQPTAAAPGLVRATVMSLDGVLFAQTFSNVAADPGSAAAATTPVEMALPPGGPWRLVGIDVALPTFTEEPTFTVTDAASGAAVDLSSFRPAAGTPGAVEAVAGGLSFAPTPAGAWTRAVAGTVPSPVPVVVTDGIATSLSLMEGDDVSLVISSPAFDVDLVVAATVPVLPGTTTGEGILVDLATLSLASPDAIAPNQVWMSSPDPAALAAAVEDAFPQTATLVADPQAARSAAGTATAFLLAAAGAVVLAIVVLVLRRTRSRGDARELALLAVLGLGRRRASAVRAGEDAFAVVTGAVGGALAGTATACLVVPPLVRAAYGRVPAGFPVTLQADPPVLVAAVLAVTVVFCVVVATVRTPARLAPLLREDE